MNIVVEWNKYIHLGEMKAETSTRKRERKRKTKATKIHTTPQYHALYQTSMIPIVQCANQITPKAMKNSPNPLI